MYLSSTVTNKEEMADGGCFLPVFSAESINEADRMEVWCSSFKDSGADYNVFKLISGDSTIAERRMEGY